MVAKLLLVVLVVSTVMLLLMLAVVLTVMLLLVLMMVLHLHLGERVAARVLHRHVQRTERALSAGPDHLHGQIEANGAHECRAHHGRAPGSGGGHGGLLRAHVRRQLVQRRHGRHVVPVRGGQRVRRGHRRHALCQKTSEIDEKTSCRD